MEVDYLQLHRVESRALRLAPIEACHNNLNNGDNNGYTTSHSDDTNTML